MLEIEKVINSKFPKLKNNKVIQSAITKLSDTLIHRKEIMDFLDTNAHLGSFEFIDAVFEYINFSFSVSSKDVENIPASGRVVIIANHPLGALDAFALIKLLSTVRKDIKVVANDFLKEFEVLNPILLHINNFQSLQKKESIKKIYEALDDEMALLIFPSGEVSRASSTGIKDKLWHKGFLKFASRSSSPILPIHISGKNSKTFYSVSAINKKLSMILLPDEIFKQKNKSINISIGEIVPSEYTVPAGIKQEQIVKLYKKHVYSLKKGKSYFLTQKAIAHPEDRRALKKELKSAQLLGKTKDGKKIYLYASDDNNSILLNEIGRLRELTFRKVGEGIHKKRDIDKYDRYYKHIILWDDEDLEIVGAYRIAECKDVVNRLSREALYTTTLFSFHDTFDEYLNNSIELGRSFVQPKYWGSRALDYLWFGIGAYLRNNPEVRYMFGPVSISATYSKAAKDTLLYFYDKNFKDRDALVSAKIPYNFSSDRLLVEKLQNEFNAPSYKENFKTLKAHLGMMGTTVPVLYKQYSDLCEEGGIKFCAYNVDPDFSNCVDSFILVDVTKIKASQKKRYIED